MATAVFGLGLIGGIWARHLVSDGETVRTWNRTRKEFPGFCATAAEAAQGAEVIMICVSDPEAVQEVVTAILPVLKSGQTVVQTSTVSAEWNLKYAAQVKKTGAAFVEAPFTGSKPAAEARKTVFYTGGAEEEVARVRPVLERLSQRLLHIGPLGAAASLKLAMNLNLACMMQALGESLALARAKGISDEVYFEALSINAGRSGLSDLKQPGLRAGDFAPMFALKHMDKDLRLALETAGDLPLAVTRRVKELYARGLEQPGWAEDDFSGATRNV